MGLRGTLFFSGFNSGTSFSVQHDVTTAYASSHEPQVRLDTSRRIWMRFPSNDWASYMRFRVHKQGAFTTNTSWSTGTTRYDTAGSPSAPANASSDILPGQNLRATSSSVTGTVPTYAHAFTSDRIKARKGFFGGKISVGSGQTDVNGTYDLYNNGTSYFNGAVTIDDNLTITNGAITGSGSGLTNLNASNISSGTINSARLATGASGNWWAGNVVKVRTDGVMEAGKYIDFHNTDTSTADYDVRLQVHSTNNLSIQGSGRIFHDGYHPNADTLTTARTIAGTSFNGSANIDISYNNLTNKPTIPTNNNQLTNGAGYITSADG